ncbi:MAG: META domain-containing protein [Chloroflexota bacterium]|nr:META domain-containing protein [Chloroflexota bacterium]
MLAIALVITIPTAAAAQAEPAGPEGTTWHLTAYAVDGELAAVPWMVDATLLLEEGSASGSNGCNQFSGTYLFDGEALTFSEAFAMTQMACIGDAATVEAGYMANLSWTATWATGDDVLQLSDAEGTVILEFQLPTVGFTESDVAGLIALFDAQEAEIGKLKKRVDNVRIGTLRDRIKELETEVKTLRSQQSSAGSTGGTGFNAAEKVLLEGIPASIRQTCSPRRSQNPAGTVAAVQCKPNTAKVRDMAYYLMESGPATTVWETRMNQHSVKDGPGACKNGKKDKEYATPGPDARGCYVDANGRANLRYLAHATNCRQVNAGGTQIKRPTLYIAVLGPTNDIAKLTKWAEGSSFWTNLPLSKIIKRPNEAWNPSCPT